jgi:hypothetical protein
MPPSLLDFDRRLSMRYANGRAFSFRKVMRDASHQGMYDLANAFASIQSSQPNRISVVVTKQLV